MTEATDLLTILGISIPKEYVYVILGVLFFNWIVKLLTRQKRDYNNDRAREERIMFKVNQGFKISHAQDRFLLRCFGVILKERPEELKSKVQERYSEIVQQFDENVINFDNIFKSDYLQPDVPKGFLEYLRDFFVKTKIDLSRIKIKEKKKGSKSGKQV